MATTHFAAVVPATDGDGMIRVVVGTRSSTSRHADGQGRFGLYTFAVLRHVRTTDRNADGSESVSWSADVISWHNGAVNAQAGLREARVGAVYSYGRDHSSYIEDKAARNGVRVLTATDPETVKVVTNMRAEVVPVIVTPKKAKIGQAVQR